LRGRETALITFLATAANITLFGLGGAFWGLAAGLIAHGLIHGDFRLSRWFPRLSRSGVGDGR
jgi:benzoate membrane transport protein